MRSGIVAPTAHVGVASAPVLLPPTGVFDANAQVASVVRDLAPQVTDGMLVIDAGHSGSSSTSVVQPGGYAWIPEGPNSRPNAPTSRPAIELAPPRRPPRPPVPGHVARPSLQRPAAPAPEVAARSSRGRKKESGMLTQMRALRASAASLSVRNPLLGKIDAAIAKYEKANRAKRFFLWTGMALDLAGWERQVAIQKSQYSTPAASADEGERGPRTFVEPPKKGSTRPLEVMEVDPQATLNDFTVTRIAHNRVALDFSNVDRPITVRIGASSSKDSILSRKKTSLNLDLAGDVYMTNLSGNKCHCQISWSPTKPNIITITDIASTNGTFIDAPGNPQIHGKRVMGSFQIDLRKIKLSADGKLRIQIGITTLLITPRKKDVQVKRAVSPTRAPAPVAAPAHQTATHSSISRSDIAGIIGTENHNISVKDTDGTTIISVTPKKGYVGSWRVTVLNSCSRDSILDVIRLIHEQSHVIQHNYRKTINLEVRFEPTRALQMYQRLGLGGATQVGIVEFQAASGDPQSTDGYHIDRALGTFGQFLPHTFHSPLMPSIVLRIPDRPGHERALAQALLKKAKGAIDRFDMGEYGGHIQSVFQNVPYE